MVLGPSSSRLVKASSVFVETVLVRDEDKKGVFVHSFSEKPELSSETNWSASNYLIFRSYGRKRFSLWLNNGSRMSLRLETQSSTVDRLEAVVIKGEQRHETLQPKLTTTLHEPIKGKELEYAIEEDDSYRLEIINSNSRSIIVILNLNVSSKMYDTTKANSSCSAIKGSCRLRLLFPDIRYVLVTTPNNGNLDDWYLELSFMARILSYIVILGSVMVAIYLMLKSLGACDSETETPIEPTTVQEVTETHPLLPEKPIGCTYGTAGHEEDEESGGSSSSSEDLYDDKLCVICYDDQRNCFFVPCGHCATCYDCALRIMNEESKVCPICRRLVHKVRRLFKP